MSLRTFFLLAATAVVLSACTQGSTEQGKNSSGSRIGVMTSPSADPQYRENVRSLDGPQSVDLVVGNTEEGR